MTAACSAFRRRTGVERRVIGILRASDMDLPIYLQRIEAPARRRANANTVPAEARAIVDALRHLIADRGFKILEPRSPWVSAHEILILDWLAHAQRVVCRSFAQDPDLRRAINRCASVLDASGHRLPLTFANQSVLRTIS